MNFRLLLKAGTFIIGLAITGVGFYIWYKSGRLFPIPTFEERWSDPNNVGYSILLIGIGAAIVLYAFFIHAGHNTIDNDE